VGVGAPLGERVVVCGRGGAAYTSISSHAADQGRLAGISLHVHGEWGTGPQQRIAEQQGNHSRVWREPNDACCSRLVGSSKCYMMVLTP
jgi:hypothetical protein